MSEVPSFLRATDAPPGPSLHELQLIHYTRLREPLGVLEDRTQNDRENFKPCGLWVSSEPDDGWFWWASTEHHWTGLHAAYRIHLKSDAKVLHVNGTAELIAFNETWKREVNLGPTPRLDLVTRKVELREYIMRQIDWPGLAQAFDGVVIAPYVWSHRYELMWYYGWDCASGCLWRPNACIERVEPLGRVDFGSRPSDDDD